MTRIQKQHLRRNRSTQTAELKILTSEKLLSSALHSERRVKWSGLLSEMVRARRVKLC